jgi:hypothetical protein
LDSETRHTKRHEYKRDSKSHARHSTFFYKLIKLQNYYSATKINICQLREAHADVFTFWFLYFSAEPICWISLLRHLEMKGLYTRHKNVNRTRKTSKLLWDFLQLFISLLEYYEFHCSRRHVWRRMCTRRLFPTLKATA